MAFKYLLKMFLNEYCKAFELLSDSDIKKLESGEYSLRLKVIKTSSSDNKTLLSEEDFQSLLDSLRDIKDREKGYNLLELKLKTRKELEYFAKRNDIYIIKNDTTDKIKEKIIEGIIGASLRSIAIQKEKL